MKASLSYVSVLLALSGLIGAAPAPSTTTTAEEADPTVCIMIYVYGNPIVAPNAGNLQLTGAVGSQAILQLAGLTSGWNFANGGLAAPQYCPSQWLNIVPGPHPWKRLVWGSSQVTTTWKTGYDSDLTAKKTLTYSQTSTFLACDHNYPTFAPEKVVFLLTDSTVALPLATDDTLGDINVKSCVKTKLHIGSDPFSATV